jgi:Lrp/AsnC family leucine-responsive transcriptional regulator
MYHKSKSLKAGRPTMDELDSKIIKLLQENARMTVSEVSNKVNLSAPAVSDRLKKLEASGLIEKYVAILNPCRFHKELTALMFISLERPNFNEKFVQFVQGEDEILECHYLAGDFDYVIKIITENTTTLEQLLNRIKSAQGVIKTRTIVALSTVKNSHSIVPVANVTDSKVRRNENDYRSSQRD